MDYTTFLFLLLVAFAAAGYLYLIYRKRGKEAALIEARALALKLMLLAEKKYGAEKGVMKMSFVAKTFYAVLPLQCRFLLTEQGLSQFLETVYRESKDYVDDGLVNGSVS